VTRKLIVLAFLGISACAGILGLSGGSEQRPFEHRAHVNQGISCLRCHQGVEKTGDTGPVHIPGADSCTGCHQEPHDRRECSMCHGLPAVREGAAAARRHLRFSHATHVPRSSGECVRCHGGIRTDAIALRPPMATCFGCHEHDGEFETRACDRCHIDLPAERVMPATHVVHEGDFLREHGTRAASAGDLCDTCHSQRFCAGCHGRTVPALREKLSFDDPMAAGVHRAGFAARHAIEGRAEPGLCASCHRTDFCAGCHQDRQLSAGLGLGRSPHGPGWLGPPGTSNEHGRAAWRNPAECASCHGGAGEALCIGCHAEGGIGGNPHPPGFSSTLDRRTAPACRLCHRGGL
jgi:hypothetical protein